MGRRLITKRIRAAEGAEPPRTLSDVDFLLGVSDLTRQGALRFRRRGAPEYADPSTRVPRMIQLPTLLRAAEHVARDDNVDLAEIKMLLEACTGTLGGARPKASVLSDDGVLQIAKFPHPHDEWDVMAWEKTTLDLAERAGISVPRSSILKIDGRTVLVVDRFDRREGRRIGYMSALTCIQGRDGEQHDYLEFAEEVASISSEPEADLADLWRRMAFSVAVHNTDDHLRNHGLLHTRAGWRLSPAFDVNPNPDVSEDRTTSIGWVSECNGEIEALLDVASNFGVAGCAREILRDITEATRTWRSAAARNGIAASECTRFERTFGHSCM